VIRVRKRYIVLIFVVLIAVVLSISYYSKTKGRDNSTAADMKKTPVETVQAVKGYIASTAVVSGKLEALHEVDVVAKVPGKVKEITSRVGQKINKGETIFVIDDTDLKDQLQQARAALSMAEANYRQNRERYENARKDLERMEQLYKDGAISEQMLEQVRASASDAGLQVLEAQIEQAKVSYDMVLRQYKECWVASPIQGVVAYINVGIGQTVAPGVPVAVVVDMSRVVLEGSIGENLVNQVSAEGEVDVKIPSAGDRVFKGIIKEISPAADQRTGLFGLKVEIDNPDGLIKPGMFAEAALVKEARSDTIVIPSSAVLAKGGEKYVYLVDDGKAVFRKVTTGVSDGERIEIVAGIMDGEMVIVKGQNYVEDGDPVEVVRGDGQ